MTIKEVKMNKLILLSSILLLNFNCHSLEVSNKKGDAAPIALKIEHFDEFHNEKRVDFYRWMHDKDDSKVRKHLEKENSYAIKMNAKNTHLKNQLLKDYKKLRSKLVKSISKISKDYTYYYERQGDQSYGIRYRIGKSSSNKEILLDENIEAKNSDYFKVLRLDFDKSENKALALFDIKGRGHGTPYILNFSTSKKTKLKTNLIWADGSIWLNDHRFLFFATTEEKLPYQLYEYDIRSQNEKLVHTFKDTDSGRSMYQTTDKSEIIIRLSATENSQSFIFNKESSSLKALDKKGIKKFKSSYNRNKTGWFKFTNEFSKNWEIYQKQNGNWKKIISPKKGDLSSYHLSRNYLVFKENFEGVKNLYIYNILTKKVNKIDVGENLASLSGLIFDHDLEKIYFNHYGFASPTEMKSCSLVNCKVKTVIPHQVIGFTPSNYISKRVQVKGRDGVMIPVSLIYKKGQVLSNRPMLLYGYGAYGSTIGPHFLKYVIPLIDRGVVYAIAHIRGGSIKGDKWHDSGRYFNKMNTFNDFIDVAKHYIHTGVTTPEKLAIKGESAGGLLMGTVLNMAPELFKLAIMQVPFVDVLNTMTLYYDPLAKYEKKEWGDGLVKKEYDLIKSYDPYTNISKQNYPTIWVETGFEDTAVYYFQPMKWVAKMREVNNPKNSKPVLFSTTFKGGHSGNSGVEGKEKKYAKSFSFLLGELGF
jgi:oligopeptidase B